MALTFMTIFLRGVLRIIMIWSLSNLYIFFWIACFYLEFPASFPLLTFYVLVHVAGDEIRK